MANKNSQFSAKNQPKERTPRGRGNKTLFLEMLREESQIELNEESTPTDAEKAFFKHLWTRASDKDDPASGQCLTIISNKCWATLKPTNDTVTFEFDDSLSKLEQATQLLSAISTGNLPPDVGNSLITSIAATIKIEEVTDIADRIEALEKVLNGGDQQ